MVEVVRTTVDEPFDRVEVTANSDSIAYVRRIAFSCDRFQRAAERVEMAERTAGRSVRTRDLVDLCTKAGKMNYKTPNRIYSDTHLLP